MLVLAARGNCVTAPARKGEAQSTNNVYGKVYFVRQSGVVTVLDAARDQEHGCATLVIRKSLQPEGSELIRRSERQPSFSLLIPYCSSFL